MIQLFKLICHFVYIFHNFYVTIIFLGYTHVNDESGLIMGHISIWSLNDMRKIIRCIQVWQSFSYINIFLMISVVF